MDKEIELLEDEYGNDVSNTIYSYAQQSIPEITPILDEYRQTPKP